MVLLSTHNICFEWEIRKLIFLKARHHNDGNLLHCNFSCLLIVRPTNKFELYCKRAKQIGSWSRPKLSQSWSGSKMLQKHFSKPYKHPSTPFFFLTNIMVTYFCHSCGSCSYALKYFCNVELMALYAFLAGNDVTSFNVTPIWVQLGRKWCEVTTVNGQ